MFNLKNLVAACVLLATCLPISAVAYNETLTFRLNTQGEVEAVIQGLTLGVGCDPYPEGAYFLPAQNIAVGIGTVLIESPRPDRFCSIGRYPPIPYQLVANLGRLSGETYQVTWQVGLVTEGPPVRSLTATLNVSDPYSVAAPALSQWALCLLLLSTASVAFAALRRRGERSNV